MKFMEKMVTLRKYCLHPGRVQSVFDGEVHTIDADRLAKLYRVDPNECVVQNTLYKEIYKDLIHLYPLESGEYEQHIARLRRDKKRAERKAKAEKSTMRLIRE